MSRWTPVLKPDGTYCSPGCGLRCTKAAHDAATTEAAQLAASLGEGWKPVVWENCGWHFSASKGCTAIHRNWRGGGYTAYFNSSKQFVGEGDSPDAALADAIAKLDACVAALQADRAALVVTP